MIMSSIFIENVYAEGFLDNVCYDISNTLKIVGYLILVARILVPLIIIFVGSFDLYKSVSAGKPDNLKKDLITIGKRIIMGIIIFLIPTFINIAMSFTGDTKYKECMSCLTKPSTCQTH